MPTLPYLNKKNSPVRVPVALNVSGKGVFKGNDLSAFWGGCRVDEAHPKWREKAPFFGAHNLIHGLKAGIPCWAWVSEGVAVLKNRENLHE